MITLQADPLIEWDESITKLVGQTTDAQSYIDENILNTVPVTTKETVHSVLRDLDWDRVKSQLYTVEGFTLNVVRTHQGVESSAVASSVYTLTEV
jgi:hypothetical protein